LSILSAQAQTRIDQATITEILDGTEVFIQGNQAQVGDRATFGQRVSTGNARTQLRFNTNAVGRLSTNSVLTIGQCATLSQGSMLVNGAINGCTTSIVAGVRGTTYIVSVDEAGQESVMVLEGEVSLTPVSSSPEEVSSEGESSEEVSSEEVSPEDSSLEVTSTEVANNETEWVTEAVTLAAGQMVAIPETGTLGLVETLNVEDFSNLLEGVLFRGFAEDLPGMGAIRQSFERLYPGVAFPELPTLVNPALDTPGFPGTTPNTPRF